MRLSTTSALCLSGPTRQPDGLAGEGRQASEPLGARSVEPVGARDVARS